ncbi:unnamed protein product [Ectocarpus fasciculatus]
MADSVQYALDRMVVDLEDLRCRGIFSEAEVRAIVARRKGFEYMLRRHEARRLDYMRYVEYELNLDSLRALRTRRVEGGAGGAGSQQRNKKKKTKKGKAATADFCCVRLVRWIFDRAVMKFPGDVDIWLHYIDFAARQGQSKALGRLFARALQLHPRNPGLWIKAASWEFFDGGNASSARSLMQRGLRINPGATNLWLQYFRLEFSYVEKLMGRREILGLEAERGGVGDNGQGNDDDGGRQGMDIPELEAEAGQSGGPSFKAVKKAAGAEGTLGGGDGARPAPVMNDTARRFYKGAVPMAVFRAAVKAIPADVGFRAGFLRCCAEDFPVLSSEAAQSILTSIEKDFPESCEAWEVRASYPQLAAEAAAGRDGGRRLGSAVQESVDTFELAVEAVGASEPDMWVRYASFLRGRLEACEEAEGRKRGGGAVDGGKRGAMVGASAPAAAAAAALAARLREVLARAVEIHLAGGAALNDPARRSTTAVTAAIAARRERGGASLLATRGVSAPAQELEALSRRRAEDSREALSAGLADVCLALGEPEGALAALRAATGVLPRRPGPWLRRAALERRLAALGDDPEHAGRAGGGGGKKPRLGSSSSSAGAADADVATATLRTGIKVVGGPGVPRPVAGVARVSGGLGG